MKIKAVIFDMDGVIIDSEAIWFEATNRVLRKFGKKIKEDEFKKYVGVADNNFFEKIKQEHRINEPIRNLIEDRNQFVNELLERKCNVMPGFIDLYNSIKKSDLKIALASSSKKMNVNKVLMKLNLKFDNVSTFESVQNHKPFPDVYQKACNSLGLNPDECVAIEDSRSGLRSAIKAGLYCIAVPNEYTKSHSFLEATIQLNSLKELTIEKIKQLGEKI